MIRKRPLVRTLAIVAEGTSDGGMTHTAVAKLEFDIYGVDRDPKTTRNYLNTLRQKGFVRRTTSDTWIATEKGITEYQQIASERPQLLCKITTKKK